MLCLIGVQSFRLQPLWQLNKSSKFADHLEFLLGITESEINKKEWENKIDRN